MRNNKEIEPCAFVLRYKLTGDEWEDRKKREGLGTVWLSYLNFCLVKACQHELFYSVAQNGALTTQSSK